MAMKQFNAFFAGWRSVQLTLVMGERPMLLVTYTNVITPEPGHAYSAGVLAYPVKNPADYPQAFMLRLGSNQFVVQAESDDDAKQWIRDINKALVSTRLDTGTAAGTEGDELTSPLTRVASACPRRRDTQARGAPSGITR